MTFHAHKLLENAQPALRGERPIGEHDLEHAGEGEIAGIDGETEPLGAIQAGLAAAQFARIGDVVVDEGGALEQLDGDAARERLIGAATYGLGSEQCQHGAYALSAARGEVRKRGVQVAVEVLRGRALMAHRHGVGLMQGALDQREPVFQIRDEALARVSGHIAHVQPFPWEFSLGQC